MNDNDAGRSIQTPEQMRALIEGLTQQDWRRMTLYARRLASTLPGVEERDLMQEAVVAAMTGRRRCPTGVNPRVFLEGAMRSCLDNWRKQAQPLTSLGDQDEELDETVDDTPERWVLRMDTIRQQAQRLVAAFDGDDRVLLLIEGKVDGLSRAEICEVLECTLTQLESMERRLRRFMARPADEEPTA